MYDGLHQVASKYVLCGTIPIFWIRGNVSWTRFRCRPTGPQLVRYRWRDAQAGLRDRRIDRDQVHGQALPGSTTEWIVQQITDASRGIRRPDTSPHACRSLDQEQSASRFQSSRRRGGVGNGLVVKTTRSPFLRRRSRLHSWISQGIVNFQWLRAPATTLDSRRRCVTVIIKSDRWRASAMSPTS